MQRAYMLIAIIIGITLTFQLIILPYRNKKSGLQVVTRTLDLWEDGDISSSLRYWYNPKNLPIVTSIDSYTITWKRYYRIDQQSYVEIYVKINFGDGSALKDGKEWLFKVTRINSKWKIVAFKPSRLKGQDYSPPTRAYSPEADQKMLNRFQNEPSYMEPEFNLPHQKEASQTKLPLPTAPEKPLLKSFIAPTISPIEEIPEKTKDIEPARYRTIPAAPSQ